MVYQTNSRQDTLIKRKGKFIDESEQSVIASIKMLGANIEHAAKNNHRPYMMMYGEVSAVAFPNGTYQEFVPKTQVHIRYEFSDSELASLSEKGLFYDGFKIPDIISENNNIEIPMTATARRYTMMDNLYVTLDLASADIYKTNTHDCGYVFADYFESQIPEKLHTDIVDEKTDEIPSFDEDFAKQFEDAFKNAESEFEEADEAFAKQSVQEKHKQSLITAEAQKLLENSPTAKREREKAAAIGRKIAERKALEPETNEDILPIEDDDFAKFRKAQDEYQKTKPLLKPYEDTDEDDIVAAAFAKDEEKKELEEENKDMSTTSDVSVSVKVDGVEKEDGEPNYGDAFGGQFDDMVKEVNTKYDIEQALQNISTKSRPAPLTKPEEDTPSFDNDYEI